MRGPKYEYLCLILNGKIEGKSGWQKETFLLEKLRTLDWINCGTTTSSISDREGNREIVNMVGVVNDH